MTGWPGTPYTDDEWMEDARPDLPQLEVEVSDNPIVAELLDARGEVIRQWVARPPIGFALPT